MTSDGVFQQQVSNASRSHFEIVVRDPVKHGDNSMSVSTSNLHFSALYVQELVMAAHQKLPGKLRIALPHVPSLSSPRQFGRLHCRECDSLTYCASGGVYRLTCPTKYVQTQVSPSTRLSSQRSSGGFGTLPGCAHGCKSRTEVRPTSRQHGSVVFFQLSPISHCGAFGL